jgi:hypothetical protein
MQISEAGALPYFTSRDECKNNRLKIKVKALKIGKH